MGFALIDRNTMVTDLNKLSIIRQARTDSF